MRRHILARNVAVLTEAQQSLNVAFGAILSAYIGNSLAEIDNRPFDHMALARFFLFLGLFILGLCVGNAMILRGELRLGVAFLMGGATSALLAYHSGRTLGFEVVVLRLLAIVWATALLGSNAILSAITWLHHRRRT